MLKRLRKQIRRAVRKRRGLDLRYWLPFRTPDLLKVEAARYAEADFSVHVLTCHRDVNMALWCLRSFIHFARISPVIVIHDDGTLEAQDKQMLCRALPRCSVIDRRDADERMAAALEAYPLCRHMREAPNFQCALKLFDSQVYATGEVFVVLDSDILFFRHPEELLACVEQGRPCFNADYQDAYTHPREELSRRLGIDVLEQVNSGLVVMTKFACDLEFMENYFRLFPEPVPRINYHEQTLHAALLSRAGAQRLGNVYQISRDRLGADTVSHHYVSDGSRFMFYDVGVRTLVRRGFMSATNG